MTRQYRALKWLGIAFACLFGVCVTLFAAGAWLSRFMSEGVLRAEIQEGIVIVALRGDAAARDALRFGCRETPPYSKLVASMLQSGTLAETPSGTRMRMEPMGPDPWVATMTITEGPLRGQQVWACRGQFALLHPWP